MTPDDYRDLFIFMVWIMGYYFCYKVCKFEFVQREGKFYWIDSFISLFIAISSWVGIIIYALFLLKDEDAE